MKASIVPLSQVNSDNKDTQKQVTPLDSLLLPPNMAKTIWSQANTILEDESAIVTILCVASKEWRASM